LTSLTIGKDGKNENKKEEIICHGHGHDDASGGVKARF